MRLLALHFWSVQNHFFIASNMKRNSCLITCEHINQLHSTVKQCKQTPIYPHRIAFHKNEALLKVDSIAWGFFQLESSIKKKKNKICKKHLSSWLGLKITAIKLFTRTWNMP